MNLENYNNIIKELDEEITNNEQDKIIRLGKMRILLKYSFFSIMK